MATTTMGTRHSDTRTYWIIGAVVLIALLAILFAMRDEGVSGTATDTSMSRSTTDTTYSAPAAVGTTTTTTTNTDTTLNQPAVTGPGTGYDVDSRAAGTTSNNAASADYTETTNAATLEGQEAQTAPTRPWPETGAGQGRDSSPSRTDQQ